jgi:hypothetical protein
MLGSLAYLLGRLPFSHPIAQTYELLSARRTIRRAGSAWLAATAGVGTVAPTSEASDQWFRGDEALSTQFVTHVKTRTNLEIGSGPMGHLASRPWMGRRVVIDPLIGKYRSYQLRRFGKTVWTDDIRVYPSPAENMIPELKGAVDGSIICRNALDHGRPIECPSGNLSICSPRLLSLALDGYLAFAGFDDRASQYHEKRGGYGCAFARLGL